ncbi:hypothetical protein D3C72_2559030 [compost metagenome]
MLLGPGQGDVLHDPAIAGADRQAAALNAGHANHPVVQRADAAGFQVMVAAEVVGTVAGNFLAGTTVDHATA